MFGSFVIIFKNVNEHRHFIAQIIKSDYKIMKAHLYLTIDNITKLMITINDTNCILLIFFIFFITNKCIYNI